MKKVLEKFNLENKLVKANLIKTLRIEKRILEQILEQIEKSSDLKRLFECLDNYVIISFDEQITQNRLQNTITSVKTISKTNIPRATSR